MRMDEVKRSKSVGMVVEMTALEASNLRLSEEMQVIWLAQDREGKKHSQVLQ